MNDETTPDSAILGLTREDLTNARSELNAAIGLLHGLAEDGIESADEIRQHVAAAHEKLYGSVKEGN